MKKRFISAAAALALCLTACTPVNEDVAAAESGELWNNGWILPVDAAFAPLPALTVSERIRTHLFNGCPTSHFPAQDGRYRVYDGEGQFLGLAAVTGGVLQVEKLFCERD